MNRTRNLWSKELNCCRREYNMTLFTIALCLIGSLPILFYTSTYCITKYQEQRQQRVLYDGKCKNKYIFFFTSMFINFIFIFLI